MAQSSSLLTLLISILVLVWLCCCCCCCCEIPQALELYHPRALGAQSPQLMKCLSIPMVYNRSQIRTDNRALGSTTPATTSTRYINTCWTTPSLGISFKLQPQQASSWYWYYFDIWYIRALRQSIIVSSNIIAGAIHLERGTTSNNELEKPLIPAVIYLRDARGGGW